MDLRALDLAIARAWPAREQVAIGSWTARLDAGVTRRPNSVLPHGGGRAPDAAVLDGWLEATEKLYRGRGLTPWLQVTGAAWPRCLAAELAARGWETGIDRTLLLSGPLPPAGTALDVRLASRPDAVWLETWWAVDPRGGSPELEAAAAILARIGEPTAFATVLVDGACVGVALGVLVDGLLVLECVATRPEARRRGVARAAVGALGCWAAEHGATASLLAVLAANASAHALYEALGLTEASAYAYARPGE